MQKGFTLIELAIVVVVIGILITGIVGAQSIIDSSQRQALWTEVEKVSTAGLAFNLEYDAIPGDFDEATDYWPGETSNGNGDKRVCVYEYINGYPEAVNFWQHLRLSKIYNPRIANIGLSHYKKSIYKNSIYIPTFKEGACWRTYTYFTNSPASYTLKNRHGLYLWGDQKGNQNGSLLEGAISVSSLYALDKKFDNGNALTGLVLGRTSNNGENICVDASGYVNIDTDHDKDCVALLYMDF
jgi:prepilin-type N-terminal cleavage/methylation domain-containing protein